MISLRNFCAAVLLTAAIAIPTFSGEISCPGVTATHVHCYSASGEISCPGVTLLSEEIVLESANPRTTSDAASLDPATGFFLSLLQGLMSIF
jgi:hypothetical protein